MNIEKQCTSFELSKRLYELGLRKESLFYWHHYLIGDWKIVFNDVCPTQSLTKQENYSAYTVAELGDMLPECTFSWKVNVKPIWLCSYDEPILENSLRDNTEANARAKCLIMLIENKIIDVEDLNK